MGKTLVSAVLVSGEAAAGRACLYVKPLQTGFPSDSDGELVARAALAACPGGRVVHTLGPHAAALGASLRLCGAKSAASRGDGGVSVHTLYAWTAAVGPQAAVAAEGRVVSDNDVVADTGALLRAWAAAATAHSTAPPSTHLLALVETAGGVASPGPGGALQADAHRLLRLPALLVADALLGGVSSTLCAAHALLSKGYDLAAVVLPAGRGEGEGGAARHTASQLAPHLPPHTPLLRLPMLPLHSSGGAGLEAWLAAAAAHGGGASALRDALHRAHAARLAALEAAPRRALTTLWWPFTQHSGVVARDVCVVDARLGERLSVVAPAPAEHPGAAADASPLFLESVADASCAWWTQGVSTASAPLLADAVSSAAGRYGHVPFPSACHSPALDLADALLSGPGRGWASRVFYSDNGASAVEVALKMALRASHGAGSAAAPPPRVLALRGSYHGDTLGAACASAPSVFNAPSQAPWYSPRAQFLDPPTAAMDATGRWVVTDACGDGGVESPSAPRGPSFASIEALFSPDRDATPLGVEYAARVRAALREAEACGEPVRAAIIEPVLHGAGGMHVVDPAFQRAVAAVCRQSGVPLVADEVFSGLFRLGAVSGCDLLGITPDVACYGKLLTGGALPLAATLASEAVFASFLGSHKTDALLHGHSFAGSAVGCAAALSALRLLGERGSNPNVGRSGRLRSLWCPARLRALAARPSVARTIAIGTVFAAQLAGGGAGYGSRACGRIVQRLRARGVLARPLGDVLYLMVSPMAPPRDCDALLDALAAAMDECDAGAPAHARDTQRRHEVVC